MLSYQEQLMLCLSAGAARLEPDLREPHRRFLVERQGTDGGFAGRKGPSDLYYTSLGLRAAALAGALTEEMLAAVTKFLAARLRQTHTAVDTSALVQSAAMVASATGENLLADAAIRDGLIERLMRLRRPDGGFAKSDRGGTGSVYQTFLTVLAFQLLGGPIPEPGRIVDFARAQFHPDGGFRDIPVGRRAGTNPTAAAVALLRMFDALTEPTREKTIAFLVAMQAGEGGLRANRFIPTADLLSTFTGLTTLVDLEAADRLDWKGLRRFVLRLEHPDGGFGGAMWDLEPDVEYTFYGLGTLAWLKGREE